MCFFLFNYYISISTSTKLPKFSCKVTDFKWFLQIFQQIFTSTNPLQTLYSSSTNLLLILHESPITPLHNKHADL